ncbi:MAG: hypothetical protein JST84_19720 [Acidobacteria bacterium]|nr:hypothetical protein [Acidobacteriota bacterium]
MKRILITALSLCLTITVFVFAGHHFSNRNTVQARTSVAAPVQAQRPHCSNSTASGTYGYRMNGSIVGVGPFLVNGFFVHNADGTSAVKAWVTINGQSFLTTGVNGTFKTNADCTGSGTFFGPELGLQVSYDFIVTDGGNQLEILNSNQGIALQGVGRRIAAAGQRPNCDNRMIEGHYGYRLEGSFPGVPNFASAGYAIFTAYDRENGKISGFDTNSFNGQIAPRSLQGTFKMNSDCTGSGRYGDSLGNTIDYVFMVVDQGKHIYMQSNYPGGNVAGVATRSE